MSDPSKYFAPKALEAFADVLEIPVEPFQADKLGDDLLKELGAFDVMLPGERDPSFIGLPVGGLHKAIQARSRESAEQIIDVARHGGLAKVDYGGVDEFVARVQTPDQDPSLQFLTKIGLRTFAGAAVLAGLVRADSRFADSATFHEFEVALGERGVYDPDEGGVDRAAILKITSALSGS